MKKSVFFDSLRRRMQILWQLFPKALVWAVMITKKSLMTILWFLSSSLVLSSLSKNLPQVLQILCVQTHLYYKVLR